MTMLMMMGDGIKFDTLEFKKKVILCGVDEQYNYNIYAIITLYYV